MLLLFEFLKIVLFVIFVLDVVVRVKVMMKVVVRDL